jgi:hypothetical protein
MKTKLFAFLATVGVARSIFVGAFGISLLFWAGLMGCGFTLLGMPIGWIVFLSAFTLAIFGVWAKIIAEMLTWDPQVIVVNVKLQKMLDIAVTLGLAGLAVIIFVIYYGEVPTFWTIIFGLAELYAVYLLHKNALLGCFRFFGVLLIAFIIFIIHALVIQYYFGRPDENGSGKIMLVGFYVALIVLTKIPERFYQSWIKLRIERMKRVKAEKIRKAAVDLFINISLFNLGNMYVYFSEVTSGDEDLNKKQKALYLEAFLTGLKIGKKLTAEDTKYICYIIGHAKYKLDSEFLNAVIDQCLLNNLSYLVFTTVSGRLSLNEWPLLFKASNKKAALVLSYLVYSERGCYDSLFNASTKVFNVDAFTGLVNCLGHFYKKSDDSLEKDMAKQELQRLQRFAIDCYERFDFMEPMKERLRTRIDQIGHEFWELKL